MKKIIFQRLLPRPNHSFFLFGPRGVGKSTWLKHHFKEAKFFDLLQTALFMELSRTPGLLEAKIGNLPKESWICIDEIQKIPVLLNEVHRLIEEKSWKFALSGSSARTLRRGGVNLLGGRAITKNLAQFSFKELGKYFNLNSAMEWGMLPMVILDAENAAEILNAYTHTYIKEEILEEGIIRKLEPFLRFLEIAGAMNGQQINVNNIASEASVPRSNVDVYFSILTDTLLGYWLRAYRPKIKLREGVRPKFYWFDPGVARAAAGFGQYPLDSLWLGRALETLIFHELRVYNHISKKNYAISFYRTANNMEIDFIIETTKIHQASKPRIVCIEVKYAKKWNRKWETPSRQLKKTDTIDIDKMLGVYMGKEKYYFKDFTVLPVNDFLTLLHRGEIY